MKSTIGDFLGAFGRLATANHAHVAENHDRHPSFGPIPAVRDGAWGSCAAVRPGGSFRLSIWCESGKK
jgi:hypothetical protein